MSTIWKSWFLWFYAYRIRLTIFRILPSRYKSVPLVVSNIFLKFDTRLYIIRVCQKLKAQYLLVSFEDKGGLEYFLLKIDSSVDWLDHLYNETHSMLSDKPLSEVSRSERSCTSHCLLSLTIRVYPLTWRNMFKNATIQVCPLTWRINTLHEELN